MLRRYREAVVANYDEARDLRMLREAGTDLVFLPTPDEVRTFLADSRPDKRARLIDRLLERPEFADFWAFKWLDLLRCNRLTIQIKGSQVYRQWLRDHVARNTPWSQVARELGIRVNQIWKWRQQLEAEAAKGPAQRGRPADDELARLRREVARLKEENEILKKAAIYFAREPK